MMSVQAMQRQSISTYPRWMIDRDGAQLDKIEQTTTEEGKVETGSCLPYISRLATQKKSQISGPSRYGKAVVQQQTQRRVSLVVQKCSSALRTWPKVSRSKFLSVERSICLLEKGSDASPRPRAEWPNDGLQTTLFGKHFRRVDAFRAKNNTLTLNEPSRARYTLSCAHPRHHQRHHHRFS